MITVDIRNAFHSQDSILEPILWNVFYDPILQKKQEGISYVGLAGDLALVIVDDDENRLVEKANEALRSTERWMKKSGLKLAPEKTEAVILSWRKNRERITFTPGETDITLSGKLKYLGIVTDQNLSFKSHIREIVEKAESNAAILTRGPNWAPLNRVVQSTTLYGTPIW